MTVPLPRSRSLLVPGFLTALVLSASLTARGQSNGDSRLEMLRDPDHFRLELVEPADRKSWEARRITLRKKLAVSAGLWPEPPRTPLNARVFDRREGNGFSVAKVHFESLPGFLATGNLYFPEGREDPLPAVLTPHGHWRYGRLENGERGSIVARCIDLARMGFVTFAIDMVGYNDSFQLPHDHRKSRAQLKADRPVPYEPRAYQGEFDFPVARLHGLSLAGLQLWNEIRALDFLCSLPEVDCGRIGVTGASGGATQALLLMALDDRVRAAAPVNIIGASKHPGCRCENMPGLWIDTSTVELAAVFAPRPLLLVSATEDPWTSQTPEREFPLLRRYYELFEAPDMIQNAHISAGHNYNAQSRAAVYAWFARHLQSAGPVIASPPLVAEEAASLGDLRVFPDHLLPKEAISGWDVVSNWIDESKKAFEDSLPASPEELGTFQAEAREMLGLVLSAEIPKPGNIRSSTLKEESYGKYRYRMEMIGRGEGDWFQVESAGSGDAVERLALLALPENGSPLLREDGQPEFPWAGDLLDSGFHLFRVHGFASGALKIPGRVHDRYSWFDSYNRSNQLEAVRDIVTGLAYLRKANPNVPVTVVGLEEFGLPALLAAAVFGDVKRVVVDLNGRDPTYDPELVRCMPVGSFARIGGFKLALLAVSSAHTVLFHAGHGMDTGWMRSQAEKLGYAGNLHVFEDTVTFRAGMVR